MVQLYHNRNVNKNSLLFKVDYTSNVEDVGSETRRRVRDVLKSGQILDRMVHDIKWLLLDDFSEEDYKSTLYLWDNIDGNKEHGVSY